MNYKIVSDGHPNNTKIIDSDGNFLEYIKSITWKIDAQSQSSAIVELAAIPLEAKLEKLEINITDKDIEQIEFEVGMGHRAWDMEDPKKLVSTILLVMLRKYQHGQG